MGKTLRKLVHPVLIVRSMPEIYLKFYYGNIIVFAETYNLTNQGIHEFKDTSQRPCNVYKQHCAEAMMKKLTTLLDWETVEEEIDGVGLDNMLRKVCHKKGDG